MRLIILDTETTGFSPARGDRMVEIGAIEMKDRKVLFGEKHVFHHYLNPGRDIPDQLTRIHGVDNAKVKGKPSFGDIAQAFLDFIDGATLVIHNASFDLRFIMNELRLNGLPAIDDVPVIDTLALARKMHPDHEKNSLDALCDRYGIERGHRALHGALLDSELLAEVYIAMTAGHEFGTDTPSQPASNYAQPPQF